MWTEEKKRHVLWNDKAMYIVTGKGNPIVTHLEETPMNVHFKLFSIKKVITLEFLLT